MAIIVSKRQLRRDKRAARRSMSVAQRAAASRAICARLEKILASHHGDRIAAYWPRWDEADIGKFVLDSANIRRSVYLPRFVNQGVPLILHKMPLSVWEMTTGYGGILEPSLITPSISVANITAAIVPSISVDRNGNRVGSGRGLYDITFCTMPDIVLISPIFSCQLAPPIAPEPHDIPLNFIVTEHETIEVQA